MLCLTRKTLEEIVIVVPGFAPIIVAVTDVRGDRVQIGVDADKRIPVHRRELFDKLQSQRKAA